ncbi:STAS domain-containing protein [Streptomyces sp. NPDC003011]
MIPPVPPFSPVHPAALTPDAASHGEPGHTKDRTGVHRSIRAGCQRTSYRGRVSHSEYLRGTATDTHRTARPGLSIGHTAIDGIRVLTLHGEIDHDVKDELSKALLSFDSATPPRTVIDLSGMTFMDSSGINVAASSESGLLTWDFLILGLRSHHSDQ